MGTCVVGHVCRARRAVCSRADVRSLQNRTLTYTFSPSIGECINQLWYIQTYYMILTISHSGKGKSMEIVKRFVVARDLEKGGRSK